MQETRQDYKYNTSGPSRTGKPKVSVFKFPANDGVARVFRDPRSVASTIIPYGVIVDATDATRA